MLRALPLVAALIVGRHARARIEHALRPSGTLAFYDCAGELAGAVRAHPVQAVIVELRDRHGVLTAEVTRSIREGFPTVPVLAYCGVTRRLVSSDVLALANAGVNELVFEGVNDDGVALRDALSSAARRATATRAMRELAAHVPASLHPLLRVLLEHAARAPSVTDVARAVGVHRKTLHNRLREAGMPGPSALLGWCRLVLAAEMLEEPGRRVEQVALALGYPSAAAFRNMLRRYTGLAPNEVRINGGLSCVLHAFKQALTARRSAGAALLTS